MISLVTLAALVRKEFIQALRDRRMLAMILAVPVIQIVIFGYAANIEFNRAETVVVDEDRTAESRAFALGLSADKTFAARVADSPTEAMRELDEGRATVALIIPRGFERDLASGKPAHVQALVDGSDPSRSVAATAAVEGYTMGRSLLAAQARAAQLGVVPVLPPRVVLEPRLLYNPSLKSRLFMVPGTAASILVIITTIVTAMGLARERELGTMEQLLVTPIQPMTLMLGKTIPYAVFGLLDETLILLVGNFLFDVPLRGPIYIVFLGALIYLVSTLGVGLLLSTLARTQQQALMGGFFFLLPAILLSGFMTPIESMPTWIQPLTLVNPVRYFIAIQRAVLLRGATLTEVSRPMLALLALGASLLVLSAMRFRRTLG